jgi:protein-L-isoaspartate(D-aspartate) O-methyltransferase
MAPGIKATCIASVLTAACKPDPLEQRFEGRAAAQAGTPSDPHASEREAMVEDQVLTRGVRDPRVLSAIRKVPRHEFVPKGAQAYAYDDGPLSIGHDQTISQPYIVALMTELLELEPHDRVLEIGTGSGYQAAILGELTAQVFSVEIVEPLATRARTLLARLGYRNIIVRHGDGYEGWPEHAPFNGIIVTAAPPTIPEPLKRQLAVGGHLVVPVGRAAQELRVLTRTEHGFEERSVLPVMFVPMTGRAQTPAN